jgi:hypothetical protein
MLTIVVVQAGLSIERGVCLNKIIIESMYHGGFGLGLKRSHPLSYTKADTDQSIGLRPGPGCSHRSRCRCLRVRQGFGGFPDLCEVLMISFQRKFLNSLNCNN